MSLTWLPTSWILSPSICRLVCVRCQCLFKSKLMSMKSIMNFKLIPVRNRLFKLRTGLNWWVPFERYIEHNIFHVIFYVFNHAKCQRYWTIKILSAAFHSSSILLYYSLFYFYYYSYYNGVTHHYFVLFLWSII